MKSIVLLCLVAAVMAAPASYSNDAQIVKSENENIGVGDYRYAFEQSDGYKADAQGEFHPGNGKDNEGGYFSVKGNFEYVGADGVTYTAHYVADENGYRVQYVQGPGGAIPDDVLKSLASRK